jgi:site-specific DNA-cytosine methylase
MTVRMVEWHCGIGGVAAALGESACAIAAVDIHREALEIYRTNFPGHRPVCRNIESLRSSEVASWGAADFWWMSPPCQPHTVLGNRRDLDDPRSASLKRLLELISEFRPPNLAMENVPGFAESHSRKALLETLEAAGYRWAEEVICPTQFGWPNRRERYYLAASRDTANGLREPCADVVRQETMTACIDALADADDRLKVGEAFEERYAGAIHEADRENLQERTNCFTSAYGRSPTRTGSYLKLPDGQGLRRFSPREVLALLDFPETYVLPADVEPKKLWPLAGNSLTLGATRRTLSRLAIFAGRFETGQNGRIGN